MYVLTMSCFNSSFPAKSSLLDGEFACDSEKELHFLNQIISFAA